MGVMFSFDSNKIGVRIKTGKFISWSWNFGHCPRIRIFYSYERNQNFLSPLSWMNVMAPFSIKEMRQSISIKFKAETLSQGKMYILHVADIFYSLACWHHSQEEFYDN